MQSILQPSTLLAIFLISLFSSLIPCTTNAIAIYPKSIPEPFGHWSPPTTNGSSALYSCNISFFEPTAENWEASGAGPAYTAWFISVDKNTTIWKERKSEVDYFVRETLGWGDSLECGISHKGCVRRPSCEDILARVKDEAVARRIHLILMAVENMLLITGVIEERSLYAQVNLAEMAQRLAHTFFWAYDQAIEDKCEMLSNFVKFAINAAMSYATLSVPFAGEAAQAGIQFTAPRIKDAGKWGPKLSVQQRFESTMAESAAAGVKSRFSIGKMSTWKGKSKAPFRWIGKGYNQLKPGKGTNFGLIFSGAPTQLAGMSIQGAICGLFPNPSKADEAIHEMDISKYIREGGDRFREDLDDSMAGIIFGTGFAEDGDFDESGRSVLSDQIENGDYAHLTAWQLRRFVSEPSLVEREMTQFYQNSIISTSLKSGMCHLLCHPVPAETNCTAILEETTNSINHETKSGVHPDNHNLRSSRFCPEEEGDRVMCQAECWRDSKKGKNRPMYGLEELLPEDNQWDLALNVFLQESYSHYREHHLSTEELFPTVASMLAQNDSDPNALSSGSGAYLPVCYSQHITPGNFDGHLGRKQRELPCLCGNAIGNETKAFLHEANFDMWVAKDNELARACACTMHDNKVPPVDMFLGLCQIGWHWPRHGETFKEKGKDNEEVPTDVRHHYMVPGQDKLCIEFLGEVERLRGFELGVDYEMGNGTMDAKELDTEAVQCSMCRSAMGDELRREQRKHIWRPGIPTQLVHYDFGKACKEFGCSLGKIG